MKKVFLLLASAALFIVGCNKEQIFKGEDGGMITATFTANLESGVATRAVADGDGAAANVNRCIMEIYYGDALYARQIARVTDKQATFNAQVVSNRGYTVAFWADRVDDATSDTGLAADKYYNTASLKEITFKSSYVGNDDARDAFFVCEPFTVQQTGGSFSATLKRPFAQMNVITTDWDKVTTVAALIPEKVNVTLKNPMVKFNAVTGDASADANTPSLTYTADVYTAPAPEEPVSTIVKTLSMDYLFASADKAVIDIDWKALHGTDTDVEHTFTAVPYQRNYRTNIKGALLTTQGKWTVTVEPTWSAPDYDVPFLAASTIAEAQSYIAPEAEGTQTSKVVDLSKATITAEDIDDEDNTIKFELTTHSPADMVNFTLPAIPQDVIDAGCTGWKITYEEGYPTKNVNVTAPEGTNVTIEAPDSHVTLNGTEYEQVTASTGDKTLVVPASVTIDNLIVKKGAVEIHGTVNHLTVTPEEGKEVVFRACEGLSVEVFAAIKGEGHDYIDSPMYTYELVGEKYNIYKLPVVAMIGEAEYPSIAAAVAAVPADNTELVTIKVMSDVAINSSSLTINKNNVVLDGQDHTIAIDETDASLDPYLVDGTSKRYGSFQMIKVSGNDVVLKNLTLDCKNYRGASLATTCGGKNVSYENIIYKGLGSGHYYGSAGGDGTLKFKNCTFETHGYAIHTAECQSVLEVSDCEIHGWVSYGDKTKSATFTNTHFYSTTDQYNGVIATIRPYCATTFTNCTFSKEYLSKYKYDGLTVRSNVVVSLKGCSVEDGELCDIANFTGDDPWIDGGVIAIDATGNATDGFTAGTFVAKQTSDIKAAPSYVAKAVEGKDNVYTVAAKPVATFNGQEYPSFKSALDAAKAAKGGKVTLVDDISLDRTDYKGCSGSDTDFATRLYVIDLNGHKISGGLFAFEDCSYTIEDSAGGGSISRDGSCLQLNVSQFMASKMCTFETCPSFTVTGGEFIGTGDLNNPYSCKYGAQIGAMGTSDSKQAVSKFLISGGKIRNMRIYNGKGEISGGVFEGQLKIEVCTEGSDKYASGVTYSDLVTTITGGTFNLAETNPIFGADYAKDHLSDQLCIKGGTFSFNPSVSYSACIPAGFISRSNGDGTWTVVAEN